MMELHRYNLHATSRLPPEITNELSRLEQVLDEAISRVGGVAFIKCGRKSCMDYAMRVENKNSKKILAAFVAEAQLELVRFEANKFKLCDISIFLWCQAMARSLIATSGHDVMETMSHSLLASYSLNPALGSVLYIRQFVRMDPALQFRIFIVNKSVTAITQKHAIFSPWLNKRADEICSKLQTFAESRLIPNMEEFGAFCADIMLTMDGDGGMRTGEYGFLSYEKHFKNSQTNFDITLIQLQPFFPRAISGLFEWSKDRASLLEPPCEFRFRRTPTKPISSGNIHFEQGSPLIAKFWLEHMHSTLKTSILIQRLRLIGKFLLAGLFLLVAFLLLRTC